MSNNQENEIVVGSVNDAKTAIREIQEKLYEDVINPKDIFRITLKLNDFLDEIAMKVYKEKK